MATVDNTQLEALVKDVETKQQALLDANVANDSAQVAFESARSAANDAVAARDAAKSALGSSVDALVSYANGLKA